LSKRIAGRFVKSIRKDQESLKKDQANRAQVLRISKTKDGRISVESSAEKANGESIKSKDLNRTLTFDEMDEKENSSIIANNPVKEEN
jgi:hypothetical protein